MNKEKYFITGASGFIGGALFNDLIKNNIPCLGIGRKNIVSINYIQCDLFDTVKLRSLLKDVSCIFHCAGYAHAFNTSSKEIIDKTWLINYEATKSLLKVAVEVGVSKFVNLSSVKAMSEPGSNCVGEGWDLNPTTEYGKSKLAAEEFIFNFSKNENISIVNLRLAMVYGRNGNGNLERMANLIYKKIFPPLPETNNRRSLVYISDVIRAVKCVAGDSRANGQTFIVAGSETPSGRKLYDEIRSVYGYKHLKFQIPRGLLSFMANVFEWIENRCDVKAPFNNEVLSRLLDSACYSTNKIENELSWMPRVSLKNGLKETLFRE